MLEVVPTLLREEGYSVVCAADGVQALAYLANSTPDAIVLDYMMPYLDGAAVLQAMRANPATAWIPVIMVSAAPPKMQGRPPMYDALLQKPFEIGDLLAVLAEQIARKPRPC